MEEEHQFVAAYGGNNTVAAATRAHQRARSCGITKGRSSTISRGAAPSMVAAARQEAARPPPRGGLRSVVLRSADTLSELGSRREESCGATRPCALACHPRGIRC